MPEPSPLTPPEDADLTRIQIPPTRTETPLVEHLQVDKLLVQPPNIAGYKITGVLGHGARGVVYEAIDSEGARVAMKVMTELPTMLPSEMQRFMREANASKRLRRHPNIVTVYETGKSGNDRYICMELVPHGRTLKSLQREGQLPIEAALAIGIAIADALAYAHEHGILHRDLKPSNVLIDEFNRPLLADFGLAKALDGQDLTITGEFMGTPRYMSPEQVSSGNKTIGPASDQYSFGVMLYELLTGSFPYPVDVKMGFIDVIDVIKETPPLPPHRLNHHIDGDLEAILLKLLEKNPKQRYESMKAVTDDLKACSIGGNISARKPSWGKRTDRWFWRHRTFLVATVMLSMFSGVIWLLRTQDQRRKNESTLDSALRNATTTYYEEKAREDLLRARAESEMATARSNLLAGQTEAAAKRFAALIDQEDLPYDLRLLARFEAGICFWLNDQAEAARLYWRDAPEPPLLPTDSVDTVQLKTYLRLLNLVMAGKAAPEPLQSYLPAVPAELAGLGYWVLAQHTQEGAGRKRLLMMAEKSASQTFTWMTKE